MTLKYVANLAWGKRSLEKENGFGEQVKGWRPQVPVKRMIANNMHLHTTSYASCISLLMTLFHDGLVDAFSTQTYRCRLYVRTSNTILRMGIMGYFMAEALRFLGTVDLHWKVT